MTEENNKTIRFSIATDQKIEKLSLKFGRSKLQLFNQMVDYFYKTGKDPADISEEALRKMLAKSHDTYTSFIKAQEKMLLIPMRADVTRMITNQEQIVNHFNQQVLKANKELLQNQQGIIRNFTQTAQFLKNLQDDQESKSGLKMKFLYILNSYIKARDSFSFTTSAKEKDELIQETRKLVSKL